MRSCGVAGDCASAENLAVTECAFGCLSNTATSFPFTPFLPSHKMFSSHKRPQKRISHINTVPKTTIKISSMPSCILSVGSFGGRLTSGARLNSVALRSLFVFLLNQKSPLFFDALYLSVTFLRRSTTLPPLLSLSISHRNDL